MRIAARVSSRTTPAFASTAAASWIAPDRLPVLEELGYRTSLVVPLVSHGVLRGNLVCHWSHKTREFDAFSLTLFEELARRAAVAIENAQMYRREKRIADEVQKALLPVALPEVAGYAFDAVYSSSERDVEVGGDWFDAFVLPDGRVVISIGDVFGRGLHAAVVMSSIRHGLRVLALQQSQPDSMLAVIDEALARDYPDAAASAVVGVLDPAAQTLTYAIAGPPQPAAAHGRRRGDRAARRRRTARRARSGETERADRRAAARRDARLLHRRA